MEQQHKVVLKRRERAGVVVRDMGVQGSYIKCLDLCEANRWTWRTDDGYWEMDIVEL